LILSYLILQQIPNNDDDDEDVCERQTEGDVRRRSAVDGLRPAAGRRRRR